VGIGRKSIWRTAVLAFHLPVDEHVFKVGPSHLDVVKKEPAVRKEVSGAGGPHAVPRVAEIAASDDSPEWTTTATRPYVSHRNPADSWTGTSSVSEYSISVKIFALRPVKVS